MNKKIQSAYIVNVVYLLLCIAGFCFGWGYYTTNKHNFTIIQAAKRANPSGVATISLWEYTEENLSTGGSIHVKIRYPFGGPVGTFRTVMYGDSDNNGEPDIELYAGEWTEGIDHCSWHTEDIKIGDNWKRPVFLGLERPPYSKAIWLEKAPWLFAGLGETCYFKNVDETSFRTSRYYLSSEIIIANARDNVNSSQSFIPFAIAGILASCAGIIIGLSQRVRLLPYLFLIVSALTWRWISGLAPTTHRWSGFFLMRLGSEWVWAFYIAGIILCSPMVAFLLFRCIQKSACWFHRKRPVITCLFCGIIVMLMGYWFWSWRSNGIYGDGYGPLGMGYEYHNPLAVVLYDLFLLVIGRPTRWTHMPWFTTIPLYSVLWGVIYVILGIFLGKTIGRNARERALIPLSLFSLPAIQVFFGYMEVYAPVLGLSVLVMLLFFKTWRKKISIAIFSIGAFFNYLHHLSAALFFPLVIAAWIRYIFQLKHGILVRAWRVLRSLIVTLFVSFFIWAQCMFFLNLLRYNFNLKEYQLHLNHYGVNFLWGSTGKPLRDNLLFETTMNYPHIYAFGSQTHIKQTFAEWMFHNPLVIPLFLILIIVYGKKMLRSFLLCSLTFTGLIFMLSTIFLSPFYPYPKDWDLFSLQFVTLHIIVLFLILRLLKGCHKRYILITYIISQLLWTITWLYYNHFWGVKLVERFFGFS